MKRIYLDYAAATPMDLKVRQAMEIYLTSIFYNPSAAYLAARDARLILDDIRRRAASVLGANPAEIIFTAGATEANNLAIQGVAGQYPKGQIIVSDIEHESVLEPARRFGAKKIPVDQNGMIILNKLGNLITDNTVLVSVMLVNNELGTIQPLKEVAGLLEEVRAKRLNTGNSLPIYLHTDAAQASNFLDLHVSRLGVDLMSINGGKIYGPKQSGVLYVKAGVKLQPMLVGGGQEFGLRSGTENIAAAAGLAEALEIASRLRTVEARRISQLRENFEKELLQKFPDAVILCAKHSRAPHITSVTLPGTDNERLMMELDERGVMCAVGSACSASREEASHVLSAIGLSDADARSTLRFSLGRATTANDLKSVLNLLKDILKN